MGVTLNTKNKVTYMYNKYNRRRTAGLFEGCMTGPDGAENVQKCPTREQVYAMAYVRSQAYEQLLSDSDALLCGTVFPSLYLPFEGGADR
jgi:hypothetical protein